MLENLFLYFGSESTNFPIMQFCNAYPQLLEQKELHHITFSDLFPDTIHFTAAYTFHDDWIWKNDFYKKNNKNVQSFDDIFPQLKKQIEGKNIKNLLIILNFNTLYDYFDNLIKCCKLLQPKNISVSYSKINALRNFSAIYNIHLLYTQYLYFTPTMNLVTKLNQTKIAENEKLLLFFAKQWNTAIQEKTYSNEGKCFYGFIKQYQIDFPKQSSFIPQATFAPQVLAYLFSLHELVNTNKYSVSLAHEHKFLYYFSKENTFFSYHTKELEKEFKNSKDISDDSTYIDCSNIGMRPEINSAIILAKQLSAQTRKLLLENITLPKLDTVSEANRITYLSLLHAEDKISLEDLHFKLTKPILGRTYMPIEKYEQNPILTIYTASYNNKKYIKQCIDKILDQKTKYPFIHLISDDNSTDGTQELLREYAQRYPHIQLILRTHNNISKNYFGMLNSITTKYVAVCDSDDFYTDDNKIEKQITFLEENPDCGLCFHPAYMYYENENIIKSIHPNSMKDFIPKKFYYLSNIITTNLMQSSSVMYRWKWPNGITSGAPLGQTPLDWALNISHAYNAKIGFINEPMSLYRRHAKAYYALTETNIPLHIIKNCFLELFFITTLNNYTERKYEKIFLEKAFLILYNFYVTAREIDYDKEKYNEIKNKIELYFSDYVKYFKDNLSKIK